jgi:hypothetical protein
MARAKESLKINIEQSTDGEERSVVIKLTAPAKDFVLPDILSEQGAIDPYEGALKEAVKGTTETYLQSAQDAVAALAARKQARQSSPPARPVKESDTGKGGKAKPETTAREETAPPPVSRGATERVSSPATA